MNIPDTGFLAEAAARLERRSAPIAALLLAAMFLVAVGVASRTPLWADDLVTFLTATLPTTADVWHFYASGLDATASAVQSLAGRLGTRLPLPPEIALRLPFIVAFLSMSLGLYGFVRRRYPQGYALAALVMPMLFPELYFLMTAARSYVIMLGATGLAMYCWQAAADRKARPWSVLGLWLLLAVAIAAHVFAVFLLIPFAVAQLALDQPRKHPDRPVWLALFLSPVGFLPFLQGMLNARANFLATFHAKPDIQSFEISYRGIYTSRGWIVVSIFLVLSVWLLFRESRAKKTSLQESADSSGFTRPEWVLLGALALLPLYEVVAGMAIGAFEDRFAIPFYIGLILIVICGFAELARRRAYAGALAFIVVLACAVTVHGKNALRGSVALLRPSTVHAKATAAILSTPSAQLVLQSSLPVATDLFSYMGLKYYAGRQIAGRLYAPTDTAVFGDPRYRYANTGQQCSVLFSRMLPIQTAGIDDFLAQHPHFLLLTRFDGHEWLQIYLLNRQKTRGDLTLKILLYDPSGSVIDVQMK